MAMFSSKVSTPRGGFSQSKIPSEGSGKALKELIPVFVLSLRWGKASSHDWLRALLLLRLQVEAWQGHLIDSDYRAPRISSGCSWAGRGAGSDSLKGRFHGTNDSLLL